MSYMSELAIDQKNGLRFKEAEQIAEDLLAKPECLWKLNITEAILDAYHAGVMHGIEGLAKKMEKI